MPDFFDTNVLVYSISPDPVEADKRARAIALLDQDDGALSVGPHHYRTHLRSASSPNGRGFQRRT